MIIKFDRSPEEFYRLSRTAFEEGALERALSYSEKALRGKGSTEYKVSLAEIFLSMERYYEAMDVALDALCHGKGLRSEIYDVMIRALSETGRIYESVYYVTRKARLEGDDEALDAMDEMMEDWMNEGTELPAEEGLFLVGEKKKTAPYDLAQAAMHLHHGNYDEATQLLRGIDPGSKQYDDAQKMMLRALARSGDEKGALRVAEEIATRDPKYAFALYYLIVKGGKTEFLPLLSEVEDDRQDLYFAVAAADHARAYDLSERLAGRLLGAEPYSPEAHFVFAAALKNAGKRAASEDCLKRLFSLYSSYPAEVILKGWARLKKASVMFSDAMPEEVVRILRRYVRKGASDSSLFVKSLLTDEAFRSAVTLLFEYGDDEVCDNLLRFLGMESNKQVDAFFSGLLLRTRVEPLLKKSIATQLLTRKHKGKLRIAPAGIPVGISCEKPPHYELYPETLRYAFLNTYTFTQCLNDAHAARRIAEFCEVLWVYVGAKKSRVRSESLTAALVLRLFAEGELRPFVEGAVPEKACARLMEEIFDVREVRFSEVHKWLNVLSEHLGVR